MTPVIERTYTNGTTTYGIRWTDETGVDRKRFSRKWSKTQARVELAKIERNLAFGVATRVDMTVTDLFQEFHKNHVMINCSPAWQDDTKTQFNLRIEPMIGHRKVDAVNRRVVREMIAQMKAVIGEQDPGNEYAGHRTINKTLTVLKGMLSYAVEIDMLASNPAHGIPELPEEPTRQIDAWPLEVVHAVASAALTLSDELPDFQRGQQAAWVGQRNFVIILLAALTGLRQSELLGLRWEQIDDGWIHVTHKLCRRSFTRRETKSRRGRRRVPLLPAATMLLDAWRQVEAHAEIVFPNNDSSGYMRASRFSNKTWEKARSTAKPVKVNGRLYDPSTLTFHELRHTFIVPRQDK
jgi:integrase